MRILILLILVSAAFLVLMYDISEADGSHAGCRPWVEGYPMYIVVNDDGLPRYNPNDTLYPGDQIAYKFKYGWPGCTCGTRTYPLDYSGALEPAGRLNQNTMNHYDVLLDIHDYFKPGRHGPLGAAEADIAKTNDCHGGAKRGMLGYGGEDGWQRDHSKTSCGSVQFKVKAGATHCIGEQCWCATKTASDAIHPRTVAPVTETIFTEHVLQDPYRYNATNADMTNYPWDPIAIEHAADFTWGTEREGTITFEYDRTFDPLVQEGGYECDKICMEKLRVGVIRMDGTDTCIARDGCPAGPHDAIGIGFVDYSWHGTNGGGMYAYTAPAISDAGNQSITYDVTVLNEGRMINTHQNITEQLVVEYMPVFEHYEYPVLKDSQRYAYDDRQGMVIWYGGSVGSGPDDNGVLNPDRRSRINAFYPVTMIYSDGDFLMDGDETSSARPPILIDSKLLQWDSVGHINATHPHTDRDGGTDNYSPGESWHTTGKGHAMFSGQGYGILRLAQSISELILGEHNSKNWYYNATTYNEIASDRWAGHDSYRNWNYTYQYPHTPFAQWYNMTSYNSNLDTADNSLAVKMAAHYTHTARDIPIFPDDKNVIVSVRDYMYAKTLHDTDNEMFAEGIRGEMHPMTNNAAGIGTLSMWVNKTAIEFPAGYVPEPGILGLSIYHSLDGDAPMMLYMTAGDADVIASYTFEFWNDMHLEFGQGGGWELDARRLTSAGDDTGAARLSVHEKFGEVSEITVDGVYSGGGGIDCHPSCIVTVPLNGTVEAYNRWGGTAATVLDDPSDIVPPKPEATWNATWEYILFVAAAAAVTLAAFLALRTMFGNSAKRD